MTACSPPSSAVFPTLDPKSANEPTGSTSDRSSAMVPTTDSAPASATVMALRTPLGEKAAMATVAAFFRAVTGEDHARLSEVTDGHANLHDLRPRGRTLPYHAGHVWRGRFRKRPYEKLASRLVYRPSDTRIFDSQRYSHLPHKLRSRVKSSLRGRDLVLKVPIVVHTLNGQRYLPDEITFWLQRREDRYVIVQMAEIFPF